MKSDTMLRFGQKVVWGMLHLAAVYFAVKVCTPWVAGRVHAWILPLLRVDPISQLQFLFCHLFGFSVVPAFGAGLINYKYQHRIASFVWIVPALILVYKFFTFPSGLFESQTAAAYHQYFAGDFMVPEYQDYRELFSMAGKRSDIVRGIEQLRFTAPLYAGAAYSVSSLVSMSIGAVMRRRHEQAR